MLNEVDRKALESHVKREIVKNSKKVREKHSNISEMVANTPKTLQVKKIYDLRKKHENFYLIIVRNHSKQPKVRYFLTILLAHQSSDLLVNLTKEFVDESKKLRLLQYSIYPKTMRVNFLVLKELNSIDDYTSSIEMLKELRKKFRQKLAKMTNLVENE